MSNVYSPNVEDMSSDSNASTEFRKIVALQKYAKSDEESEDDTDADADAGDESDAEIDDGPNSEWLTFMRKNISTKKANAGAGQKRTVGVPKEAGIGLFKTQLKFETTKRTHVIMIDSLDRDQHVYPLPTQARLKLPRIYKNVERIDIVQLKFFCGLYAISATRRNNTLWVSDAAGRRPIVIPDGTYPIASLLATLSAALSANSSVTYTATFNSLTGRIQIAATGPFRLLYYTKASPLSNQTAYSEWGLGWVLGWGGLPVDLTATLSVDSMLYTVIADNFPRIIDDYIYLQLNDTERMNDVDHTSVENTAAAQDSTGQVAHYFGKLLLNSFGCYAQTFIESPKLFAPVLGRLDRLNFTWTDRNGNPLAGPDAASCNWHMTLRITEIVEIPLPSSTLTQSVNRE